MKILQKITLPVFFISIFLIGLVLGLGYFTQQNNFWSIIGFYIPFFLIYIYLNQSTKAATWKLYFFLSIFLRFLLIFSIPNLSDDIYRFIWDGRLLVHGYNPFDHLPTYYIDNNLSIAGIDQHLFDQLNSPEYFTIYPPIAQGLFAFAVWLFPDSIYGSAIVMKSFLFLCELGSLYLIVQLLAHWKLPAQNVLLYALNPLIIIEVMGNLHFEGAMIFFLLLALFLIVQVEKKNNKQLILAGLIYGFSIASKLLTLLFLPFFIKRLGWKKCLLFFMIIGVTTLLLFLPLISGVFIENFGNSLNLYFQKFEFNASVYYIARWIGYQVIGWNMIAVLGPSLALCTLVSIFLLYLFDTEKHASKYFFTKISLLQKTSWSRLPVMMLFAFCIYLTFTTTIHPWYIALPIVLCVFTRYRFPILWSGLIMLTYVNYHGDVYQENLWIVSLEYALVFTYLCYELFFYYKNPFRPVSSPLFISQK